MLNPSTPAYPARPEATRADGFHTRAARLTRALCLASTFGLGLAAHGQSTGADGTAPTVTSIALDAASVTPTAARFTVTFSEPVTGVDVGDFAVNATPAAAATLTGITPGATAAVYHVDFTYSGASGSLQLAIKSAATAITDAAGNAFVGAGAAASDVIPVNAAPPADAILPTVASFSLPTGPLTSPANLTLVFSEPVTGLTSGDFVVSAGGTVGAITGSGTTWTVPVVFTGTAPITVTLVGGATADIRDAATHWFAGGTNTTLTLTPGGNNDGGTTAAPVISSPLTASVAAGSPFSYTVTVTNSPTSLTVTGLPAGLTFTAPTISGTVATAGVYNVTLTATNAAGTDTENLAITVTAATTPPGDGGGSDDDDDEDGDGRGGKGSGQTITLKRDDGLVAGEPFTLPATTASGEAITWILVSGNATLVDNILTPKNRGAVVVRAQINGKTTKEGNVAAVVAIEPNDAGTPKRKGKGPRKDRLSNLSSRVHVSADHDAVAGFVVDGSASKQVLIRAVGPSLKRHGVTDAVAGAEVEVFDASGKAIARNDGWRGNGAVATTGARLGAFALESGSEDAALLLNLEPGLYTARIRGKGQGTALLEVYDATDGSLATTEQLVNISTRGRVGAGGNIIAGFVVGGDAPKRVLIRAVGPGLKPYGVSDTLADSVLELYTAAGVAVARNDNWQTPVRHGQGGAPATMAEILAAAEAAYAFPLTERDSALVVTLLPGVYTAVMTGVNGAPGAGMIEVFELPLQ